MAEGRRTDGDRLRQVLANLVENAVKYSPDGGVVELRIDRRESGVRFSVRDEGLGFPSSEHDRIFDRFYRLDPHLTRSVGGTGLGLYICRELVRRLGGRISVSSEPGQGSTFFVDLAVGRFRRPVEKHRKYAPLQLSEKLATAFPQAVVDFAPA